MSRPIEPPEEVIKQQVVRVSSNPDRDTTLNKYLSEGYLVKQMVCSANENIYPIAIFY